MRALVILGTALFAACSQTPALGPAPTAGNAPTNAQQAYFTGYPAQLFFAAGEVCNGPGQSVVRPSANEVRCESLPDPEAAAAIILRYEGTVEDLPKFVISFAGRETAQGYLVTADNYIRVPQRGGSTQQIRFNNPEIARGVSDLLEAAGGRPI